MCIRTLYSERDFVLRSVIANRLEKRGFQVDLVVSEKPDFLDYDIDKYDLMVLSQPRMNRSTIELVKEIKKISSSVGLVFIFDTVSIENQIELYDAGVDIIIPKPIDIDLLVARVNSIKRRLEVSNYKRTLGDVSFNISQQFLQCNQSQARLNPTEAKLMLVLADNIGKRIVTNEEITKLLYNTEGYNSAKGAKVYIYRIRNKLKRINAERLAIKNHYGNGYYLAINEEEHGVLENKNEA